MSKKRKIIGIGLIVWGIMGCFVEPFGGIGLIIVGILVLCLKQIKGESDTVSSPAPQKTISPEPQQIKKETKQTISSFKSKNAIATFKVSLTNTFHYEDELNSLNPWTPLYLKPPEGKERSFRVQMLGEDDFITIGTLPADISKVLLTEYANCQYVIKSHHVTFNNYRPGCDVVVLVKEPG